MAQSKFLTNNATLHIKANGDVFIKRRRFLYGAGLFAGLLMVLGGLGLLVNAFSPFALTRASFELISYNQAVNPGGFAPPLDSTPSSDGIGPMIVYLASDKAAEISGTIFSISAKSVGIFSDPIIRTSIENESGNWTVEDIMQQAPNLFEGYETHVIKRMG